MQQCQSPAPPRMPLFIAPFAPRAAAPAHASPPLSAASQPHRVRPMSCTLSRNSAAGHHLPPPHPSQRRAATTATTATTATASDPAPVAAPDPPDIHAESLRLLEWPQISAHVVDYASTQQGRAALCPSPSGLHIGATRAESERLLAETREVYYLEYTRAKPLSFAGVHDVSDLVALVAKGRVLTGKQLVSIAKTLYAARAIRRHIDAEVSAGAQLPVLQDLVANFRTWPDKERDIMTSLDEFGDVVDTADPQLRGIRQALRDAFTEVRTKLNAIMAKHSDAIQDRVITQRYDRFVIPVKMSRKSEFRRGVVHDASSTGSTAFIEPASVRPINDRLRELTAKEKARVNAILRRLSESVVAPIADDVDNLSFVIAIIDAAAARARCSRALGAVDVVFDDTRPVRLLGARHPLLSWKAMKETRSEGTADGTSTEVESHGWRGDSPKRVTTAKREPAWKKKVIPSSYELEEGVRCVCVTGPNTGGKTLSLKTLGTCVLMAKAGLFVPARPSRLVWNRSLEDAPGSFKREEDPEDEETARLPYFDSVLADIGDDQSLVQSLSTFSGHIQRIKRILAASTARSLVLLDEIGSGTDPAEGAALGMAILRHLAIGQRAGLTFATTHHGELKALKYGVDSSARYFENASVEFDDVRMAPTFKLVWGIPGRSNALAIASRLGLDSRVIDEAHFLLTGSTPGEEGTSNRVDIEKMISSLEKEKNAAEEAREEAERSLFEIDELRTELQERLSRLRESEKTLREDQKDSMDMELDTARKQIAEVIREMQKGGGSAQAANRASEQLGKVFLPGKAEATSSAAQSDAEGHEKVDINDISVGDKVVVPRLGFTPKDVVQILSRKELLVAIGAMKAKVKVKEVASVSRPLQRISSRTYRPSVVEDTPQKRKRLVMRTASNTVDIRGERVDSAEAKVDQAIDKAMSNGLIWIIHGHGTGRLRSGIRKFLKEHSHVEKIEDATQLDGGTGVTVAYLR